MCSYNVQVFLVTVIFLSGTWPKFATASFTANDTTPSTPAIQISAELFSQKLVSEWGNNGIVDAAQLSKILERLGIYDETGTGAQEENSNCSAESLLTTHGLDKPGINAVQLQELCPSILYSAATGQCTFPKLLDENLPYNLQNETDTSPTPAEVWGYGFLFVTIINLGALAGVWVVPIMNKKLYKNVLMFLICLAVGTLCGNALLSLIPEAHGMLLETHGQLFIWKNLTVIGGIYLFFLTERMLKMLAQFRRRNRKNLGEAKPHTFHTTAMHDEERLDNGGIRITAPGQALMLTDSLHPEKKAHLDVHSAGDAGDLEQNSSTKLTSLDNDTSNGHAHSHGVTYEEGDNMIATVAYMIIFGDGLHNFIDGLAIGASFAHATYAGVSTSIAVICEEFPHELGDFAILLNSGMSVKNAVLANVGSSLTCYLGLVVGIVLGEMTSAGEWIFALAGGMFLYISLVDMLPEINSVTSDEEEEGKPPTPRGMLKVFFLQNLGLLSGFALMLVLALYAGKIQI